MTFAARGLRVLREHLAEADATEHAAEIGSKSPTAAWHFVNAVDAALARLSDMPELGIPPTFTHPRLCNIRVWSVAGFPHHLIFYQVTDKDVRVLRVLHQPQGIAALFESNK